MPQQAKAKIILEGKVKYDKEESGAALIAHISSKGPDDPGLVFVRIQSYDERAWENSKDPAVHRQAKQLAGKRVRVTIEEL